MTMTTRAFRIVADHMRAATFIMGDRRAASSPGDVESAAMCCAA